MLAHRHSSQLAREGRGRRLRMVGRIASGGMGSVYRAEYEYRPVALKVLHNDNAGQGAECLLSREASALRRIRHPNVVGFVAEGETSKGAHYLAMELVSGPTLAELLTDAEQPLPLERGLRLLDQVLSGLAAAHAAGVVHGDIKPHNVIVEHAGTARERAVLVDFGLARLFEGPAPAANAAPIVDAEGATMGSADYLAPERVLGCSPSTGADLYAVGVLLYRMLTGELPFAGADVTRVIWRHLNEEASPPSTRYPFRPIPAALDAATVRALAKRASDRFASAGELATIIAEVRDELAPRVARVRARGARRVRRHARAH